ncbi:hypothetical protein LCGC14_1212930 [marine sediment metagenome]|uniref:Uncharacterized protein n=1 Tax=marine sediment metagenome TaxID=412755 RepID=A0A0F9LHQ2_9ZZZZ
MAKESIKHDWRRITDLNELTAVYQCNNCKDVSIINPTFMEVKELGCHPLRCNQPKS